MKNWEVEKIENDIKTRIEEEKTLLEAWRAVTFPTKKNGEQFEIMSKNICGATYKSQDLQMQPGEKEIIISAKTAAGKYVSDRISAYETVDYLEESKKAKTQNYMPKQVEWLKQIYKYDLDDIKEAIKTRINDLEREINISKKQLEKVEEAYNFYKGALKQLAEITSKNESCALYYAIKDIANP